MKTIPEALCPQCKKPFNVIEGVEDGEFLPNAGDVVVCTFCCAALLYETPDKRRLLSSLDERALPTATWQAVFRVRAAIRRSRLMS